MMKKNGMMFILSSPSGAGKTTLFNIIAGNIKPTSGKVFLDGQDITGIPSYTLFGKGLLRTFQIAHEFSTLTVLENLMMVPGSQSGENLIDAWFNHKKVTYQEKEIRKSYHETWSDVTHKHIWNYEKAPILKKKL